MPDHVTTRLGVTGLDATGSDFVTNFPASYNAALDAFDGKITGWASGVFASRPAAGTVGRTYLATDDTTGGSHGTWYFDNGTTWEAINGQAQGCFSAWRNASLTISSSGTVVVFDTKEWDVSTWYSTSTGRFTPQLAGFYRLGAAVPLVGSTGAEVFTTAIRKNGAVYKQASVGITAIGQLASGLVTAVVQANGSTDYFDIFASHTNSSSPAVATQSYATYFQGEIIGRD